MRKVTQNCLGINAVILTILAFAKFSEVTWFAFIWFPGVFTLGYYLDEIIDFVKVKIRMSTQR
ncbi:hypothetical protein LCGC14_0569940 [marine sediment metagenome]|uniref:Uncharacterized protein n=1 Tax=marine sediment metagenome TaxID=412755 RepID=A0A0F9S360_9ZZZZ